MVRWLFAVIGILISVAYSVSLAKEPVVVAEGHGDETPRQPQVATDAKGVIHIAFGKGNRLSIS